MKSLLHVITSLLRHYYVIITSLLPHYSKWLKQVIMSPLLPIMHFRCFHYYIIITHYYHYYLLLHVRDSRTCRCMKGLAEVFNELAAAQERWEQVAKIVQILSMDMHDNAQLSSKMYSMGTMGPIIFSSEFQLSRSCSPCQEIHPWFMHFNVISLPKCGQV